MTFGFFRLRERIDARITNAIEEARFVVAEVTGERTSVYFESRIRARTRQTRDLVCS